MILQRHTLPYIILILISAITVFSCETENPATESEVVPSLSGISPVEGYPGETLLLTGENIVVDTIKTKVQFGELYAKILSISSTEIKFMVPLDIYPGTYTVKLLKGPRTCGQSEFTIPTPEITSFSPGMGIYGTKLTIKGKNFGNPSDNVWVYFGDYKYSRAERISDDELRGTVPLSNDLDATISLEFGDLGGYETNKLNDFKFANWFYFKKATGKRGEEIVIVVNGGSHDSNNFYFNDIETSGKWSWTAGSVGVDEIGVDIPVDVEPGIVKIRVTSKISSKPFIQKDTVDFIVTE